MKLYGLFVIKDEGSLGHYLAYSHDMDKLKSLTPHNVISTVSDPNSKYLRMSTDEGTFPVYRVYEVSFII